MKSKTKTNFKIAPFWKPIRLKPQGLKINQVRPVNIFSPRLKKSVRILPIFQPILLKKYPSRTKSEWRLIDKNPFGDTDKDGVVNIFDCKPLNRKKQSKMLRREIAERVFGAAYYSGLPPTKSDEIPEERLKMLTSSQKQTFKSTSKPMGPLLIKLKKERAEEGVKDINEKYKEFIKGMNNLGETRYKPYPKFRKGSYKIITEADVVKVLEKNPDLIQEAEKVKWESLAPQSSLNLGVGGEYGSSYKGDYHGNFEEKSRTIAIAEAMTKRQNLPHTIKHELAHHKQYEEGTTWHKLQNAEEKELLKFNEEKAAEWKKRHEKNEKKYGYKYTSEFSPYYKLPWRRRPIEIDAEKRANTPYARDIAKLEGEKPEVLQSLESQPIEAESKKVRDIESAEEPETLDEHYDIPESDTDTESSKESQKSYEI